MIIDRRDIFGQALSDKAFGCKVMRCLSFLIVLNLSGALYAAVKTPGPSTGKSTKSAGAIDESKPQSPTLFRLERYKEFLEKLGKGQGESTGRSQKKGSKLALVDEQKLQPVINQINQKIAEITQGWPTDGSQANIRYVAEWFNHFVAHHSWSMTTLVALPPLIAAMSYLVPAASGIYGVHGLFIFVNNMSLFAHQQATNMVCSYLVGSAIKQTTGYKLVGAGAIAEKMIRKYFISLATGSFLKNMYNEQWMYDNYLFLKTEKMEKTYWEELFKQLKPILSGAKTFLKEGGIQVSGIPTIINNYYVGVWAIAAAWKQYPDKLVAQAQSMYMDFIRGSPLLQLYQFLALSDKQLSTGLVGDTEKLPDYLLSFDGVRSFKPTPGSMAAAIKFRAAIRNAERLVEQSRYYSQSMLDADKNLFEESLLNAPDSAESINQTEKEEIKKTLEKDRKEIIKAMKKS